MEKMLVVMLSHNVYFLFYGILRHCTISIFSINENCTISFFCQPGLFKERFFKERVYGKKKLKGACVWRCAGKKQNNKQQFGEEQCSLNELCLLVNIWKLQRASKTLESCYNLFLQT